MNDSNFFNNLSFWLVLGILIAWLLAWKGLALWKAGKNQDKVWFIILFLINTLGILDIIYLFAVKSKMTVAKTETTDPNRKPEALS